MRGREGIDDGDVYQGAAFHLYRNYDGAGGTFGSISVAADSDDREQLSIWAAVEGSTLHVILIHKNREGGLEVDVDIEGGSYEGGRAWGFGPASPAITEQWAVQDLLGNSFTYRIPALTAVHLVLE